MPAAPLPADCRLLELVRGLVLLVVLCAGGGPASPHPLRADEPDTPLAPPDRSSPRATLQTFVEHLDEFFDRFMSEPLSEANRARNKRLASRAIGCLDLSHVAPSLVASEGRESAVQLKEVLDRVPLPAWDEIPDAEMVTAEKLIRWRLPGTEITLAPIAEGPRAGEWLFTTDSVQRSDDFYQAVAGLPYRADAGSPGLHEIYVHTPGWLIPEALIHALPAWMRADLGGAVTWQWLALGLLATAAVALASAAYRLAWRAAARPGLLAHALALAAPLVIVAAGTLLDELFTNQVRFTGPLLFTLKTCLQAARFAGWILFVRAVLGRLSEAVIQTRRLRPEMIDTQLLRLGFRLVTFLATAWMVIMGADSMGVSVTPLIAGLGVSGLAVALAAQHTIENFIAGLVLFADKPVRIGEFCQFGDHRGTVEQIGLRSTRIRGFDRTVISIPNSEFAKLRLVNFTRRDKILLQKQIGLRYETTADQLRHLLAGLREMLTTHPRVERESVRVRFIGYGAYSLDVEIYALVRTSDWATFLTIQEDVLLKVMDVIGESGCGFAFPSQTHYVTTDTGVDAEVRQRAEEQVRSLRAAGGLAVAGFLEEANNRPAGDPPHRLHRPAA
jgi:MscS family membrane protein